LDDAAIPYEVLGKLDDKWMLLDRFATSLLEIPAERFIRDLDSGLIEEMQSFYEPFLKRIANATLTSQSGCTPLYLAGSRLRMSKAQCPDGRTAAPPRSPGHRTPHFLCID
jgi:hypothetical protein